MTDIGDVPRKTLRANGVDVSFQEGGESNMMILAKGDILEVRRIPERVKKKSLHYLSRTFDIPIYIFFNPLMAKAHHA